MLRSRLAAVLLAVPLLVLGGASAASAAPAESVPRATGWSCDGDVCLRYVPQGAAAAPLDDSGCSRDTCIEMYGGAGGYSAIGYADDYFYGHVDLWGPGLPFRNGPEGPSPTVSGNGRGVGAVCAQGWASIGGGRYESRGLPCVDVE
ncbi:hypothetical protein AB0J86_07475 [Micromonospora sp. NPDC049559]|uniref:hypothetical protein n=1 Tax=Micromonospora sp. NPDC049559 TaxID=3155923 RepID=UPI0034465B3A